MCCLYTRHRRSAPHTELQWYTCISALGYPQPSALFRATLCKSHVIYFEPRRIRVRAGLVRYLIAPTDYCTGGRDPALTRCGRETILVAALDSTANPRRCVSTASRRRYAYSTWPNVSVRTFLRPYHVQGGGRGGELFWKMSLSVAGATRAASWWRAPVSGLQQRTLPSNPRATAVGYTPTSYLCVENRTRPLRLKIWTMWFQENIDMGRLDP